VTTPPWSVDRGFVRDVDGRAVILRGVNMAQKHKHAPYFDFHTAEDFARIRNDWGMNSIRFLLSWAALEPQPDVFDEAYLAAVRTRMDWARDAGLVVILDMHQDVYGEGFGFNGAPRWTCSESHYAAFTPQPQWYLNYLNEHVIACFDAFWGDAALQDHLARAWHLVALRLADHPAVVGFDVMNEPFLGSYGLAEFEPAALQPFYESVVTAVRQAAPDWIAFLEPFSMRNLGYPSMLTVFPFPNVVYSPHAYDAAAEQGMGFDPARRQPILDNVAGMAVEATALGAALWIGEYGGTATHAGITPYMDAVDDAVAAAGAGSMYWHYGKDGAYGMLDAQGNEKPALLAALVRPFPERVAGDGVRWTFDDATAQFTLGFTARTAITAPTRISAPARVYPNGPTVECTGCDAVVEGQVVVVQSRGDTPVQVVLRR